MPVEYLDTTGSGRINSDFYLPATGYNGSKHDSVDIYRETAQTAAAYQVALPIIFGSIITIGIVGNVLVVCVIATTRKLRTVTNYLLLNLAMADILFLLLCGPLTVVHYALMQWPLGDSLCRMIQYFLYVTCYVTIYTLVTVAAVRYTLVVKGSVSPYVTNTSYTIYVIFLIWFVSLLINIPVPLTYGVNSNNDNVTECVISCQVNGQTFFSLFFGFAYVIPLAIIGTFYVILVRHLAAERRHSMVRQANGSGSKEKSGHVTRVLACVVVVFTVCWLPLHIHLLWGSFGHLPASFGYKMSLIVWHSLVFLNSALNPIIYSFVSAEFREAFLGICNPRLRTQTASFSGSGSRGVLIKS
ncbi:hypothetical protein LSH36_22g04049 [Paralvinella palmiformis]|uniref:G-protein coupled receptors family 1 profile domain-containing protein n=1 Tax=Paralvinella palmiformis TaxID=53620 RepID=A0AAD9NGZ6_9ANNE|nr:hypothetical protein LSH36_22g04049 [Paralvinella palmiformis]